MPFFNFRRGTANPAASQAAPPESLEALRRRAKHRLIGSIVLVLAGVVGFPLLFDTQPRPVAVDIPIEIPGKTTSKPLVMSTPAAPAAAVTPPKPVASGPPAKTTGGEKVAVAASLAPEEEIIPSKPAGVQASIAGESAKKEAKPEPKVVAKVEPKPVQKPDTKPDAKPLVSDEAVRARALLNGEAAGAKLAAAPEAVDANGRLVVQVGAFADVVKAREARVKLEAAGLKTYTQVAETKDGKRIRVRVGPFATRADADKAAGRIKTLGLPAAVLTL